PSSASAVVVLPHPDSPTSASTSPRATSKDTPSTISAPPTVSTRSDSTASASSDTAVLHVTAARARDPVGNEVDADRQERDRRRRHDHEPRLNEQAGAILADHQRPVGLRRPLAEAEVADRAEEDHGPAQPEAEVREHRR